MNTQHSNELFENHPIHVFVQTLTEEDRDGVEALFASTGENLFVDDENYIDMATAVSASGPAYVYVSHFFYDVVV